MAMDLDVVWCVPNPRFQSVQNEIHVWRAMIDVAPDEQVLLASCLDGNERTRASQFIFGRDRNQFVAARGILRQILGGYLRMAPEKVALTVGKHGKPILSNESRTVDLRFNLSHSSGLALFAVTIGREVGIDIEQIRAATANESMQASVFTAREHHEFQNMSPKDRGRMFFIGWTCKEAYVKARGEGLQIPFKSFEVLMAAGQPPRLQCPENNLWDLLSFRPHDGFAAALVVEGKNAAVRFWDWS